MRTCTRWSRRFSLASVTSSHDESFEQFAMEEIFLGVVGRSMGVGITILRPSSRGSLG